MERFDFAVIGAGIAGASLAYELGGRARVLVLEREGQPGYHTTGRSVATYAQSYAEDNFRAFTIASWRFLSAPPAGFATGPILTPRGSLTIGAAEDEDRLDRRFELAARLTHGARRLNADEARDLVPILRPERLAGGVLDPGVMDIDVNALHQQFLRGCKSQGGKILCDAEVIALARHSDSWQIETRAGTFSAAVVVNAAGAWCDEVAAMAGAAPLGLVPKRRTVIVFAPPQGMDITSWPVVDDVNGGFYFKPDSGRFLGSAMDATPAPPCDVQPEELDIAVAADRIENVAAIEIRRIERKWAGLRTFAADEVPVVGFDPLVDGFFWLAGQGGFGIQTAPAMGRTATALITDRSIPDDLADLGLEAVALSPARFGGPRVSPECS